jgi:hypothetical protein
MSAPNNRVGVFIQGAEKAIAEYLPPAPNQYPAVAL